MQTKQIACVVVAAFALVGGAGCDSGQQNAQAAPKTSTLVDTKPKAAGSYEFEIADIDEKNPAVSFMMDAPNEKIRGTLVKATTGKIQIPLDDITKTTGHLYVDLGKLLLVQNKPDADGQFSGEFKAQELQNDHAKEWLQVTCEENAGGQKVADDQADACQKQAKLNKNVEFVIEKVETDTKDVTKLTGDTRKVIATVSGKFLLHQIAKPQSAKVEIVFNMKGDAVTSIAFKTLKPFAVKLSEHNVGPNDAFGKFAKSTLQTLDQFINKHKKVAEAAEISFDFKANFTKMLASGATGAASAPPPANK